MKNALAEHLFTTAAAELHIEAPAAKVRECEPVTCGFPCPRGWLRDPQLLLLRDQRGQALPLQTRVLDRWADGSIRWALLDWQASVDGTAIQQLSIGTAPARMPAPVKELTISRLSQGLAVDTGIARFEVLKGGMFPFRVVPPVESQGSISTAAGSMFRDPAGNTYAPIIRAVALDEEGPLRCSVRVEGAIAAPSGHELALFFLSLHMYAGSATVRFDFTLRNPRKAGHPGGLWDLGNDGSIFFREAALQFVLPQTAEPLRIRYCPEVDGPWESCSKELEIYQDSSGGQNWRSTNHLNRHHVVPHSFCGYRIRADGTEVMGRRATPIVALERGSQFLAVAVPHFWQNFPKAIAAEDGLVTLSLFPHQSADCHELQGGEQKTHTFFIAFARDSVTAEPLAWCRSPLLPRCTPAWYCAAVGSHLLPRDQDPNIDYVHLVDAAIEGDDSFECKREVIDEYGWRHFGEIYGDHEGVFHQGPAPLVSHYNNQYDPVAGFAYQYFRSTDERWWRQMQELARHVIDIDVYHCDQDKAAYNRGLFWHTYHYVDADTGTHRSYPRAGRVCGGGPSDEHNYTTGLMLYHLLTGDPLARQTVIDLAQWVIDIDNGRQTIFRWLNRGATGLASSSGNPLYHGPGRGAGNSINALLDGHRLTENAQFLAKAEELIRRCIHPADDIDRRELLDAERRWYYTVFLQALGKYLECKAEHAAFDFMYAYARASLIHYARWMAEYEYPYLDKPDRLEYPTETWAAQDMRKCEVFLLAAKHATAEQRQRFLERADYFFHYVTRTLTDMKTRTLCRPVVLLLSYGFMHGYFRQHSDNAVSPTVLKQHDFGRPQLFIPQKAAAIRRFKALVIGSTVLAGAAIALWVGYLIF